MHFHSNTVPLSMERPSNGEDISLERTVSNEEKNLLYNCVLRNGHYSFERTFLVIEMGVYSIGS